MLRNVRDIYCRQAQCLNTFGLQNRQSKEFVIHMSRWLVRNRVQRCEVLNLEQQGLHRCMHRVDACAEDLGATYRVTHS